MLSSCGEVCLLREVMVEFRKLTQYHLNFLIHLRMSLKTIRVKDNLCKFFTVNWYVIIHHTLHKQKKHCNDARLEACHWNCSVITSSR